MRTLLALALCAAFLSAAAPALAQTGPSFREVHTGTGGLRLTPSCRVGEGLIAGGTINLVSPETQAAQRRPQLRGIATRLVARAPASTSLTLAFAAEAADANAVLARLAGQREAIEATFRAAGHEVVGHKSGPVTLDPEAQPMPARMQVTLTLAGDVDPLAAMALLPAAPVVALERVSYAFPDDSALLAPIRDALEAEARADAERRVALRDDGAAILKRTALDFPSSRRIPAAPGRRMIEVSAVATYMLSLPAEHAGD